MGEKLFTKCLFRRVDSLFSVYTTEFAEKVEQNLSQCLSMDDAATAHLAARVSLVYPCDYLTRDAAAEAATL